MKANELFERSEVCLFELNEEGTVLYCRTSLDTLLNRPSAEVIGRNFFEEASPFENTCELRPLLNRFVRSDRPAEDFTFACRNKNKIVRAKIIFIRAARQTGGRRTKTTIIDIRKISHQFSDV